MRIKMCKKTKGCGRKIDSCMKNFIERMNIVFDILRKNKDGYSDFEILACCCGHGKYPMTLIVKNKHKDYGDIICDFISGEEIPRTRRFYKKDKQGYYYIPEVVNDKH